MTYIGTITLLARASGAVNAQSSVADAPVFQENAAGQMAAAAGISARVSVVSSASGRLDALGSVRGSLSQIVSFGGASTFFSGAGMNGNASISLGGQTANLTGAVNAAAGFFGGVLTVRATVAGRIDATASVSSYANTTYLTSGTLAGAANVSANADTGHSWFATGILNATASTQGVAQLRERLAATAAAQATIQSAPALQFSVSGRLDGAGNLLAYVNTSGLVAGRLDGAAAFIGGVSQVQGPSGTTWFLAGRMDAAGGSPAQFSSEFSQEFAASSVDGGLVGRAVIAARSGISTSATAIAGVTSAISIFRWGMARASGEGSFVGDGYRVTFATSEIDAVATNVAVPRITAASGAQIDVAGGIVANATRVRFAIGRMDAVASIVGKLEPVSFAQGNIAGSASMLGSPKLIALSGGSLNAAPTVNAKTTLRASARAIMPASASMSGDAVRSTPSRQFSTQFSSEFG